MYDYDHQITFIGTVTRFEWSNPHTFIELDVPAQGVYKHYNIECASPNVLTRVGWKYNELKPGDRVRLTVNPLKNGNSGGMLQRVMFRDGRVLENGNSGLRQHQKEAPQP
jgi:hypothetical protein